MNLTMKQAVYKALPIFFLLIFAAVDAQAQFSIPNVSPENSELQQIRVDSLRNASTLNNQYFNEARYRAEKKAIWKERNTIEFNAELKISQTTFDNWAKGGDNTFAGRAALSFKHSYTKSKFTFDYSFDARYGITMIGGEDYKNEDQFRFHAGANWAINKNWSYGATLDFRSQFARGYKSRTDKTIISDFMAPGVLDIGGGFTYKHLKEKLEINIAPMAGSMTFVLNEELSQKGAHGVEKGKKSFSSLGSSLRLNYSKKFFREKFIYTTYLYAFTNYGDRAYIQWDNKLEYLITKWFSVSAFCSMYYENYNRKVRANDPHLAHIKGLQTNYVLGLGLTYHFKNK